jgi:hypothetical protein
MNKIIKITGFGFIVWLIPTIITLLVSYLKFMSFFDVISALAIAVTVIVFTYLYFRDINVNLVKEGVIIGMVWLIMSLILDIVLIYLGITKLSLMEYAIYVAPLYVIVPAITIGFGLYKDQIISKDIEEQL